MAGHIRVGMVLRTMGCYYMYWESELDAPTSGTQAHSMHSMIRFEKNIRLRLSSPKKIKSNSN